MDDGHVLGIASQEQAFFDGAVAAADHHHIFPFEEPAIAGGAVRDSAPGQFLFARDVQVRRGGAGGDDQGIGQIFRRCRSGRRTALRLKSTSVAMS